MIISSFRSTSLIVTGRNTQYPSDILLFKGVLVGRIPSESNPITFGIREDKDLLSLLGKEKKVKDSDSKSSISF